MSAMQQRSRPARGNRTALKENSGSGSAPIVSDAAKIVTRTAAWSQREMAAHDDGFRFGYRIGYATAYDRGYAQALRDVEARQADIVAEVLGRLPSRPYVEQEQLRWDGPRSEFGAPRPGDYTGGPIEWGAV